MLQASLFREAHKIEFLWMIEVIKTISLHFLNNLDNRSLFSLGITVTLCRRRNNNITLECDLCITSRLCQLMLTSKKRTQFVFLYFICTEPERPALCNCVLNLIFGQFLTFYKRENENYVVILLYILKLYLLQTKVKTWYEIENNISISRFSCCV